MGEKTRRNAVVQEPQQVVEVAIQVEQADRFGVKTKLSPSQGFKQLFERPEATGHSNDPIS